MDFYAKKGNSSYYNKSKTNENNNEINSNNCTSIILKPETHNFNSDREIRISSNFSEAKNLLESKFRGKLNLINNSRKKEKNLVIKVKKNVIEEELQKDNKIILDHISNNSEIKTNTYDSLIINPNQNKNIEFYSNSDDKDIRCNYSENFKETEEIKKIKVLDKSFNNQEEIDSFMENFIEPII
jgi:hypothetical protein